MLVGEWMRDYPDAVLISARRRQGLDELLSAVEETLSADLVDIRVRIPYSATDLVNTFHRKGIVESEDYSPRRHAHRGQDSTSAGAKFQQVPGECVNETMQRAHRLIHIKNTLISLSSRI